MLSKCLHGKTQTVNKSFNGMIWNRVSKRTHVVIAHFNYGQKATIDVFHALNIAPGTNTTRGCMTANRNRKRQRAYNLLESTEKRLKILRYDKKAHQDNCIEQELMKLEDFNTEFLSLFFFPFFLFSFFLFLHIFRHRCSVLLQIFWKILDFLIFFPLNTSNTSSETKINIHLHFIQRKS